MDKLTKIAALEKAINEKYGRQATQNPKANWSSEKEEAFEKQREALFKKKKSDSQKSQKVEYKGFLLSKKLINKENTDRICPVCSTYSFKSQDDVYMTKYQCCFECYVQYVEDREERWMAGWRPNSELQKND